MRNGLGLVVAFLASVSASVGLTRWMDGMRAPPSDKVVASEVRSSPQAPQAVLPPMPRAIPAAPERAAATVVSGEAIAAPAPVAETAATDRERVRFEKEQTFETDAAADAESRAVERDLHVAMQRLSSGSSQVQGVECRRTTCRATLRSTDLVANRDMLERLADEREGPLATYGFIVPGRDVDARGEVRSTLFVSIR